MSPSAQGVGEVNVQHIMDGIRKRVRAGRQRDDEAVRKARKSISRELLSEISRLNARIGGIRANAGRIAELPPSPPTFRGRLGAAGVRLVRRMLFWLIPVLQATHEQVALALESQAKVDEELVKAIEQVNVRLGLLQSEGAGDGGSRSAAAND